MRNKIKYLIVLLIIPITIFVINRVTKSNKSYAFSENYISTASIIETNYKGSCLLIVGDTLFTDEIIGPNNIALAGARYAKSKGIDISKINNDSLLDYYKDISYAYCGKSYNIINGEEVQVERWSKFDNDTGSYNLLNSNEIQDLYANLLIRYINDVEVQNNNSLIVNIALDSRPISREYVENLSSVYGLNYIEIGSNYLDGNTVDNGYYPGDSKSLFNSFENNMPLYNSNNTNVIVNTSSLFYGGLIALNVYHDEILIENNVNRLENIIKNNNDSFYNIVITTPRVRPEYRLNYYKNDDNDYIDISLYYAEDVIFSNIKDQLNKPDIDYACDVRYTICRDNMYQVDLLQIIMQYEYIKSYIKENNISESVYNNPNTNNYFYLLYQKVNQNDVIIYDSNNNVVNNISIKKIINQYEDLFESHKSYMNKLLKLKSKYNNVDLIYGIGDYEIPDIVEYLNGINAFNMDVDQYNNPIKYSYLYSILNDTNNFNNITILAADEINSIITSRIGLDNYNRKNENKYYVDYSLKIDNILKNEITHYEYVGAEDFYNNTISYINKNTNKNYNKIKGNIYMPYVKTFYINNDTNYNVIINEKNYNLTNKDSIVFLSTPNVGIPYTFNTINDNPILNYKIVTNWNTRNNAIGLGISKSLAIDILEMEFKGAKAKDLTDYDYNRLEELVKMKINTYIEDKYNNMRYFGGIELIRVPFNCSYLRNNGSSNNNLYYETCNNINQYINNALTYEKNNPYIIDIGDIQMNVYDYQYTIYPPWNRLFDAFVTDVSLKYDIVDK